MVTQEEIEMLLAVEAVIRQRRQLFERLYTGTLGRLRAGAAVEKGPHTLKVGPGDQYLVIDGVPRTEFIHLGPARPQ